MYSRAKAGNSISHFSAYKHRRGSGSVSLCETEMLRNWNAAQLNAVNWFKHVLEETSLLRALYLVGSRRLRMLSVSLCVAAQLRQLCDIWHVAAADHDDAKLWQLTTTACKYILGALQFYDSWARAMFDNATLYNNRSWSYNNLQMLSDV